jgi:hypothetical protein
MSYYYYVGRSPDYLEHHGILGMKWGVRRFQNKDGSLTPEGRARYGDILTKKQMQNYIKDYNLRTGANKKITKNTVFKTADGMYDYKGRKMNTDVTVDDPMNDVENKTETKPKKISDLTDSELAAINKRMQLEEEYKKHLDNTIPPKKVNFIKSSLGNLKNNLVNDLPKGISSGLQSALSDAIKDSLKTKEPPKKTDMHMDTTKASDKDIADLATRWENLMKIERNKRDYDNRMAEIGEEMLSDYWPKEDKAIKYDERSKSDMEGNPLNPDNYRYYLDDKSKK